MPYYRSFLVERGESVVISKDDGETVSFATSVEFYKYCPLGEFNIDLTDWHYRYYNPTTEHNVIELISTGDYINYFKTPHNIVIDADMENIIDNIVTILTRVQDPLYGMDLAEAQAQQRAMLKEAGRQHFEQKYDYFDLVGMVRSGSTPQFDADYDAVSAEFIRVRNLVNAAVDVAGVKTAAAQVNWPVI